jgi:hypothetical protein
MKVSNIQATIAVISFILTGMYSVIKFIINRFNKKLDSLKEDILESTDKSINNFIKKNEESRAKIYEKIMINLNKINNDINLIKNNYEHQNTLINTKMTATNQLLLEQVGNIKIQLDDLEEEHDDFKKQINDSEQHNNLSHDDFKKQINHLEQSINSLNKCIHDK